MEEKKKHVSFWLRPDTIARLDVGVLQAGCRSRSDFTERAIDFYTGYLSAGEHTSFFADIIPKVMSGIVRNSESRLARLHFKSIVELAKLAHTVASQANIDDETLRTLHIQCVEEVKRINGVVRFEDAVHYQHDDD